MEGLVENKFLKRIKFLRNKIHRNTKNIKSAESKEKLTKRDLQKMEKREGLLKKKRVKMIRKKSLLEKKIDIYEKKDAEMRARKRKTEEDEARENDLQKKREIEKKRWGIEDERKKLESEKWKIEDRLNIFKKNIREIEKEITKDVNPLKKRVSRHLRELELFIEKKEQENLFLRKKIQLEERKEERRRKEELEKNKKVEEERRRIERKKEKKIIKKIRENAFKRKIEQERRLKEQQKREEQKKKELEEQQKREKEYEYKVARQIRDVAAKKHLERIKREERDRELERKMITKIKRIAREEEDYLIQKEKEKKELEKKEEERVVNEVRRIAEEEERWINEERKKEMEREKEEIRKIKKIATEEEKYLRERERKQKSLGIDFEKRAPESDKKKELEAVLIEEIKRKAREKAKGKEEKIIREIKHKAFLRHHKKEEELLEKTKTEKRPKDKEHEVYLDPAYEERVVKQIRNLAKKREEYNKEQRKAGLFSQEKLTPQESIAKKMDDLLDIIKSNKEEIFALKKELLEKEKERFDEGKKEEIQKIKDQINQQHKKLEEREGLLKGEKKEKQDFSEEKRQIDLIRERIKEEQEKFRNIKPIEGSLKIREKNNTEQLNRWNNDFSKKSEGVGLDINKKDTNEDLKEIPEGEKWDDDIKKDKKKLTNSEAEALFEKAEQSFSAGSMATARERFNRIVERYDEEKGSGIFGRKSLKEKSKDYLRKIDEKKGLNNTWNDNIKDVSQGEKDEKEGVNFLAEERDVSENEREKIVKEVRKIIKERKEAEGEKGKLEQEKESYEDKLRELREKKKKIEKDKKELLGEEKQEKNKKKRERLKKRREEMEKELRRMIKEETGQRWGEKIKNIEEDLANVSKKYNELTKREKYLRSKVEVMSRWGPYSRKNKDLASDYRFLYRNREDAGETINDDLKRSKKIKKTTRQANRSKSFLSYFKPSNDFILSAPYFTALDISDNAIKIFSINKQRGINFYGKKELREGVVYNGEIKQKKELEESFLDLLKNTKPKPLKVEKNKRIKAVVSLPESKVFVQQLKVKKEEDIIGRVEDEIGRNIPVPIDKLYFYYHAIILPGKKEKLVLCAAVEKRTVKQYVHFLQSVDIDPIVFDIEAASIGRALLFGEKNLNKKKQKNKSGKKKSTKEQVQREEKDLEEMTQEDASCEMIVDMGARITTISIFYKETISFSVSVPFGGAYFTEKIAKGLAITKEEAEEKKKKLGLRGETRDILLKFLEKIIKEIREAERYYSREFGGEVDKVIITGGSALIPGILSYFKEELGDQVFIGNSLKSLKSVKQIEGENILSYCNAIGLAIRSVEKNPIDNGLNLLPEDIKKQERRLQQERKTAVKIGAFLIALIGIIIFFFSIYFAVLNPGMMDDVLYK